MIPDPQNVFESLQNDVAAKLMETSPFSTIKAPDGTPFQVLTEDACNVQFEYDTMISQIGLCLIVKAPSGSIDQPDIPGPLITKMGFDVWISENPLFNQGPLGTGVRRWKAMGIVLGTLHLFQPQSAGLNSSVYAVSFTTERDIIYSGNEKDRPGTLINSIICKFAVPQTAALVSP